MLSTRLASDSEVSATLHVQTDRLALANALRRALLSLVPTMAIDTCWIKVNTTSVPDEQLAHALGMLPMTVDPANYTRSNGPEDRHDGNHILFRLRVRTEDADRNVTAADLEWVQPDGSSVLASAFAQPDALVVEMWPDQQIDLEAHAVVGSGDEHAKWSPVSKVGLIEEAGGWRLPFRIINGDRPERLVKRAVAIMCDQLVDVARDIRNTSAAIPAKSVVVA